MQRTISRLALVGILAAFATGIAMAQEAGRGQRRGERAGAEGRRFDPAQMRERMAERMKETLQVTDDEWAVLEPKVTEVMTLSREAGAAGRGMLVRRRRPGDAGDQARERELSNTDKAAEALRTTLDNKTASAEEVRAKITALREARESSKQKLAKAQEELRQLLTQRQEAELILMGYLN